MKNNWKQLTKENRNQRESQWCKEQGHVLPNQVDWKGEDLPSTWSSYKITQNVWYTVLNIVWQGNTGGESEFSQLKNLQAAALGGDPQRESPVLAELLRRLRPQGQAG